MAILLISNISPFSRLSGAQNIWKGGLGFFTLRKVFLHELCPFQKPSERLFLIEDAVIFSSSTVFLSSNTDYGK